MTRCTRCGAGLADKWALCPACGETNIYKPILRFADEDYIKESIEKFIKNMKHKITKIEKITDYKWLNLYETTYEKNGKQGKWAFASRHKSIDINDKLLPDAVVTVPILVMPNGERKLVLIKEYRIPIQNYEYHFPAGLLDKDEKVEDCAKRELKEEAGFDLLKINLISPIMPSSAGMTNESSVMVFAECVPGNSKQELEPSEDIEVILLNHAEVCEWAKKDLLFAAKAWPVIIMFSQMISLEMK